MWVVLMISSLRVTRVSPDRAQSLSPARLDYALSDGPLAQGTVMDPRIVNPQLEEIVSEAVRRAETDARERGYDAGYQQARDEITATVRDELGRENEILRAEHEALMANQADVRNQLLEAVQLMQALAQEMDASFVPTYESVGQDLADVVVALVEDLLGRRLAEDRAHVLGAITRAVAEIPESGEITVRIHPDDAALLEKFDVDLASSLSRTVHIEQDSSIDRHGAVVLSGNTNVDGQIRTRLARLREALGQ